VRRDGRAIDSVATRGEPEGRLGWLRPGFDLDRHAHARDPGQDGTPSGVKIVLRILVVDDCKDGADSLATLLRMWGHEAKVAYDGADALHLAAVFRPHVLLLDIGLPEMDGYDLARQLRADGLCPEARLVAVSGYGDPAHQTLGKEAGFDEYLVKPVGPTEWQELLGRWKLKAV
jgi:CheY-like chemotaxis protein